MRDIFNQELKQLGSDLETMSSQVATAIERAASCRVPGAARACSGRMTASAWGTKVNTRRRERTWSVNAGHSGPSGLALRGPHDLVCPAWEPPGC